MQPPPDTSPPHPGADKHFVIETATRLSHSLIWRLQEAYFTERGIEAWRQGEVPHYITSNPTIANSYAEVVLALWRDRRRMEPGESSEPLTICELGAGSGRFAFHFLRRLEALCEEAAIPPRAFRYVLTDAAAANLEFWRAHPNFEPFFADARLDLAQFDLRQPSSLALRMSGAAINPSSLRTPLVVIANYVFDSVPQDLFYIKDKRGQHCTVSLVTDTDPATLDAPQLLARLLVKHGYEEIAAAPYPETWLNRLLAGYQQELRDTHLLLPVAALRCLQLLSTFSQAGLVVLSADKGTHLLEALDGQDTPTLTQHGSVSLTVNYHALTRFCTDRGGIALVPDSRHDSIDVTALLMLAAADDHEEMRRAYRRYVKDFGPDAFYSVIRHARPSIPQMSSREILAYLRLSHYDSDFCARCLTRLAELAPEFDDATRQEIMSAVEASWEMHFPIGEEVDLANAIARLFQLMNEPAQALVFYERSMALYGPDTGTLCNIGACYLSLGERARAGAVLRKVLEYEPDNESAKALLAQAEPRADKQPLVPG